MEKINFNKGWQYHKRGEEQVKAIDLPHDAMICEKRDPNSLSGSAGAFFPGGVYIYEKKFTAPDTWREQCVTLQFEGVYKNSKVYLNDEEIGGCAYGYSQFFVKADGHLRFGAENTLKVIADNQDMPNSRWYSGTGIYRPVWLLLSNRHHIDIQGVKITTISYRPAKVRVDVTSVGGAITSVQKDHRSNGIQIEIFDQEKVIAAGEGCSVEFEVPNAKLWSEESPYQYQCQVKLMENGIVTDTVTEHFGIRLVEWSAKGLFINGQETLLRGGCIHHDNGILGAGCYVKSEERRVRKLKEAGYNALRISHNPASTALLEACDRLGMYVIDETWDMWYRHKNKYDYATDFPNHYQFDIESLAARDYNHPSVIMYSIGNEVSEPAFEKGLELTKEMVSLFHSLDPGRPVTAGMNLMIISSTAKGGGVYKEEGGMQEDGKQKKMEGMSSTMFNMVTSMVGTGMNKAANSKKADAVTTPCLDSLDIAGYNYASGRYTLEGKAHPNRLIYGSETFPQDIVKNWTMVKKYPYIAGDFMWTAWDYLGENGLGAWAYTTDGKGFNKPYPWLLADAGTLDILGNPNGEMFLAQAAWGQLKNPVIAVQPVNHPGVKPAKMVWRGTNALPSWSWRHCEGNKAIVEVYSDSHAIELILNGKKIGKKKIKSCVAKFSVGYQQGVLEAVAFDGSGNETGRSKLCSAEGKLKIQVAPEEDTIALDDIAYIKVDIVGINGVVESNEDTSLSVSIEGGELLAFGSANPRTEEEYTEGRFTTYYGRAQAVVRGNIPGIMTVRVSGKGLTDAVTQITVAEPH